MGISTCRGGWLGVCGKSDAPPALDALAGLAVAAPAGLAGAAVGAELGDLAAGLVELEFAVVMDKKSFIKKG
jgi:L-lactate permease